jgi:hypothetical protein
MGAMDPGFDCRPCSDYRYGILPSYPLYSYTYTKQCIPKYTFLMSTGFEIQGVSSKKAYNLNKKDTWKLDTHSTSEPRRRVVSEHLN